MAWDIFDAVLLALCLVLATFVMMVEVEERQASRRAMWREVDAILAALSEGDQDG
jgi:hypothetical protein